MSDEERAPLLANDDDGLENPADASPKPAEEEGFFARALNQPLTELSRVLIYVCIVLLLLLSVFIGLFAGVEHRLSQKEGATTTVTNVITTTVVPPAISSTFHATRTLTPTHTWYNVTSTQTATATTKTAPPKPTSPPKPETCTTSECVILAASILSGMNTTADPCEDFYEYSNGAWVDNHPLPAGKSSYGTFDDVSDGNNLILKRILSGPSSSPAKSEDDQSLKKLRAFYSSCTNEEHLDQLDVEPLLEVAQRIRQLLPVKNPKVPESRRPSAQAVFNDDLPDVKYDHDLTAVLAYLHSIGVPGLFSINIEGDAGVDPDFMVLWISQSDVGLPAKEYYEDEETMAEYTKVIKQLLETLDDSSDISTSGFWPPWPFPQPDEPPKENKTARADRLSREIINFETKLAEYGADPDTLFNDPIGTYNPVPFANFTKHTPFMDLSAYVGTYAVRNFPSTVIVTYDHYFKKLNPLLVKTSPEVLQAYFIAQAALTLSPYLGLGTEAWQTVNGLNQFLRGVKKPQPVDREKWCLDRVQDSLGFMAGRFFVNEVFGKSARQKAFDLVRTLVEAFNKALPSLSWMAKKDQKSAAQKALALRIKVGYPLATPNTMSAASVASYYRLVQVSENTFFNNVLSARVSDQFKKWQMLGKARDHEVWEMYPAQVNAYYEPPANEIVFPAGILRPPFFGEHWPSYINYGAIGAVIAHELTHAFDSAGRLYNPRGKLESWWSNYTSAEFETRKVCLADQYSSFYVVDEKGNEIHVNGNLTSGENIGDSGLIHSWRAWKAQSNITTDFLLPGLEHFTSDQLFFLAFARAWAGRRTPSASVLQVRTDPHSPALFRVHGTVSNIPEFAKTFNCSAKAKLNPEHRCNFWG